MTGHEHAGHEWISVADLMAGVVGVVVLLFVVTAVSRAAEAAREAELRRQGELRETEQRRLAAQKKQETIAARFQRIEERLQAADLKAYVGVDAENRILTLRETTFERGDTCMSRRGQEVVRAAGGPLLELLRANPSSRLVIEGHSDNVPVKGLVRRACGAYDDNLTLSAVRARTARLALIGASDDEGGRHMGAVVCGSLDNPCAVAEAWRPFEARVSVAGHGASRPVNRLDPAAAENRRVEIRYVEDPPSSDEQRSAQ